MQNEHEVVFHMQAAKLAPTPLTQEQLRAMNIHVPPPPPLPPLSVKELEEIVAQQAVELEISRSEAQQSDYCMKEFEEIIAQQAVDIESARLQAEHKDYCIKALRKQIRKLSKECEELREDNDRISEINEGLLELLVEAGLEAGDPLAESTEQDNTTHKLQAERLQNLQQESKVLSEEEEARMAHRRQGGDAVIAELLSRIASENERIELLKATECWKEKGQNGTFAKARIAP